MAFYNCTSLADVYYTGTQEQWDMIKRGWDSSLPEFVTIHYNYVPVDGEISGDIDGDSVFDANDIAMVFYFVNAVGELADEQLFAADLNADGKVNLFDAARWFYKVNGLIG